MERAWIIVGVKSYSHLFVRLIFWTHDNGKPALRPGRKAMGLCEEIARPPKRDGKAAIRNEVHHGTRYPS